MPLRSRIDCGLTALPLDDIRCQAVLVAPFKLWYGCSTYESAESSAPLVQGGFSLDGDRKH